MFYGLIYKTLNKLSLIISKLVGFMALVLYQRRTKPIKIKLYVKVSTTIKTKKNSMFNLISHNP